jgi:DNA replication protein DnaC
MALPFHRSTSHSFSNWPVVNISSSTTIIALGNSGTGKTHAYLALGLAACQRGSAVAFFTAAGLVHQFRGAREERRLVKLQAQLAAVKLLIVDELGYVPLCDRRHSWVNKIFAGSHREMSGVC